MPRQRPRPGATGSVVRRSRRATNAPSLPFNRKLVLNQWLLGHFGVERFEQLAEYLADEGLEGVDENNISRFHHALVLHYPDRPELTDALLLDYDEHIVAVTRCLNERRITRGEQPIVWKYFQYLTLLFTEIYLDRYFHDPRALRAALNAHIVAFNEGASQADRVAPLAETSDAWPQLNKVALWSATGSGKTLLMHANILQYRRYLDAAGRRRELNRILLLTPNEGLSQQHLREFETAGIDAELFNKDGRGLFAGQAVEILDIHKLRDEMGDKTVAVDAFEGNNLVLVDEGHRGASAGEEGTWMQFRSDLCERGFSFEYSATFGQAVKGKKGLTDLYARSILFDYSYRYFYGDGFGKDYQILNLDQGTRDAHLELYLTACLLAFYQQQRLFRDREAEFRPFNIDKPLWVFVGGRVTATLARKDASDIIQILQFLARVLGDRTASIQRIQRVLTEGLVSSAETNLFANRFAYLHTLELSAAQLFDDVLAVLFNAPAGGTLHVENLKGATGEVALRVGDNAPFGVINVGDDSKLVKLCEEKGLQTAEREFSGSLFHEINEPHSTVNVLIGSKKFTEGWNSWRVSTMGLMNVGATEGSQIIQLFGRGVRLKGYSTSLKRSTAAALPYGVKAPRHISVLETLGIFGIHADYMAQFRDFLAEEGLPSNEGPIEISLPWILNLGDAKLKTIRLKKTINGVSTQLGDAFRKLGPVPTLGAPDALEDDAAIYLRKNRVALNWYPKIQALASEDTATGGTTTAPNEEYLEPQHVAFLDIDRVFFDLERFKSERGWHNLNVTRHAVNELLHDHTWYRLLIPEQEMAFGGFDKVRQWQEIAASLLKKYTERYYTFRRNEWELPHLEYQDLTADDPNLRAVREGAPTAGYTVRVDRSQLEIVAELRKLQALIEREKPTPWAVSGMKAIWFAQHLYQPLLSMNDRVVEITPAPLNAGERRFVEDLKAFHDSDPGFFTGKGLYLLRNQSKGRGIGFFEAGNFHPDFILWLLADGRQHVAFVDPKGTYHVEEDDPKIEFYKTIKEIEQRLGDPAVALDSFIVSNTTSHVMQRKWKMDKATMQAHNVVFQEDTDTYIGTILRHALGS